MWSLAPINHVRKGRPVNGSKLPAVIIGPTLKSPGALKKTPVEPRTTAGPAFATRDAFKVPERVATPAVDSKATAPAATPLIVAGVRDKFVTPAVNEMFPKLTV
jgi:hypothetical protein